MKRKTIHAAAVEEVLSDLDLLPLSEVAPAVDFHATTFSAAPRRFFARLVATIPKRLALGAGIAALAALLAGIGWSAFTRDSDSVPATPAVNSSPAVTVPQRSQPSVAQPTAAPETPSATNASQIVPPSNSLATNTAVPVLESEVVRVGLDDTLYKICTDNFGRYDAQVIAMIHELNPALGDPRKIRAGQELRIPTPGSLQARTNLLAEHLGNTSALEAKNR